MSLILVVESEGRHAERVRDGLGSDGWKVEVVTSCEAAVAAVACALVIEWSLSGGGIGGR